jgi:hypothetical protein
MTDSAAHKPEAGRTHTMSEVCFGYVSVIIAFYLGAALVAFLNYFAERSDR